MITWHGTVSEERPTQSFAEDGEPECIGCRFHKFACCPYLDEDEPYQCADLKTILVIPTGSLL